MFTPPPSPLPPRQRDLKAPVIDDDPDSDMEEGALAVRPPKTPPRPVTRPSSQQPRKAASRRFWIPLFAVALVLLATASSRGRPTPKFLKNVPLMRLVWTRPPPEKPHLEAVTNTPWRPQLHHHLGGSNHPHKRWATDSSAPSGTEAVAAAGTASATIPGSSSPPSGGLPAAAQAPSTTGRVAPPIHDPPLPVPTPFPQAFDTSFSYNFTTSSCQAFFANSVMSNITYRECRPLSLLLQASSAFIQAQSNLTLLTSIIGGTCNTVETEDQCQATMDWMSQEIQKGTVCGKDLEAGNALAVEALHGFENYGFMRQAGCLVNQITNSYCFVDAVAASSPSDYYFFSLPLGNPFLNNTVPTCSTCTESVLAIYATVAGNATLPLSKTYPAAASIANDKCGAKYAVEIDVSSGATSLTLGKGPIAMGMALGFVFATAATLV